MVINESWSLVLRYNNLLSCGCMVCLYGLNRKLSSDQSNRAHETSAIPFPRHWNNLKIFLIKNISLFSILKNKPAEIPCKTTYFYQSYLGSAVFSSSWNTENIEVSGDRTYDENKKALWRKREQIPISRSAALPQNQSGKLTLAF